VGREYKGRPCASRIKQHFGDTPKWDFREAGNPTFFFIDGAHSYEYCKSDSEKCFELCNGRGVFLWHDVEWAHPGVIRFLTEWRQMGAIFGASAAPRSLIGKARKRIAWGSSYTVR
jgi:hypothetical protein